MADQPIVVGVFNTSPDVVELLRFWFQRAGFVVVSAMTYELRDGEVDLSRFLDQHAPAVIVYDIAPPYDDNWRLFQHLSRLPAMEGIPVVLTTTNAQYVSRLAGTEVHEVIGKPYDLREIIEAAKTELAKKGLTPPEGDAEE